MENQVLSIKQMQEFIKLGIDTSKASMLWYPKMAIDICTGKGYVESHYLTINHIDSENFWNTRIGKETIPTFTLQDILEILPHTLEFKDVYGNTHFEYIEFWGDGWNQMAVVDPLHPSSPRITTSNISPLRAAFEMLKWCKQNNEI